jgi:hypothetical protein
MPSLNGGRVGYSCWPRPALSIAQPGLPVKAFVGLRPSEVEERLFGEKDTEESERIESLSQEHLAYLVNQKGQIGLSEAKARSRETVVFDVRGNMLMVGEGIGYQAAVFDQG